METDPRKTRTGRQVGRDTGKAARRGEEQEAEAVNACPCWGTSAGPRLPIGVRLAGVMTFAPFFGSDAFPARVKAALVLALTALLYGVCRTPEVALTIFSVTRLVLKEAVIGLLMGLSVQIVLEGAQLAGQLAGAQLGFSLAAIIDPQTNIETPVLAIFYQMIALLIFLQLNVHHWILRAVVKSFAYFPAGTSMVSLAAARNCCAPPGPCG